MRVSGLESPGLESSNSLLQTRYWNLLLHKNTRNFLFRLTTVSCSNRALLYEIRVTFLLKK
jgi:hypothetical protein